MMIELAICFGALIVTIVLAVAAVRSYRRRQPLAITLTILGIVAVHLVGAQLAGPRMRGYSYRTADSGATFLECPFKGVTYDSMLAKNRDAAGGAKLFRTFKQEWWNYYRWHDYATHTRWSLPYRSE